MKSLADAGNRSNVARFREAEGLEAGVDAVGGGVVTGPGLLDPRLQIPPLLVAMKRW